ncbi:E3 ubiquitin-protein ligase MARCHF8-like [Artemia franciscana]|uniref:RING-CH-type domain-containing protein n=1 Tax=Artemia franciscana TaxID=6661 RepID=A0AA88I0S8_ARTSF|nr:hypothetical protein QYM36_006637 [Artemia franciscana]KAK2717906.1 hypothetical protein QYM36_006637 [Artemia franciscana]
MYAIKNTSLHESAYSLFQDTCRICHCEGESDSPLISPCLCTGSLLYVHQGCLQKWVKASDAKVCELCKYPFRMQTKVKPFREWEMLSLSKMERRKIACSVGFHTIAFTCVIWSLYVLIDRSAEELQLGQLEWPFWTKLVVVAIGITGGIVFMYVQCTMYVALCRRWRAYNRIVVVQNVARNKTSPEKQRLVTQELFSFRRKSSAGKGLSVSQSILPVIEVSVNPDLADLHLPGMSSEVLPTVKVVNELVDRLPTRSLSCGRLNDVDKIVLTKSKSFGRLYKFPSLDECWNESGMK